jgi:hypothetical protein
VTPGTAQGTQGIEVRALADGLAPGRYSSAVTVREDGGTAVEVAVVLEVQAPGAPKFGVDTASIELQVEQGSGETVQRMVVLTGVDASAVGNELISWSASTSVTGEALWLAVSKVESEELPFTFEVFADATGMAEGTYDGMVTVKAVSGTTSSATVAVRLVVKAPRKSRYSLTPTTLEGGGGLYDVTVVPADEGLSYTTAVTGGGWLKIEKGESGTMPAVAAVALDAAGLEPGVYRGQVSFTAGGETKDVTVELKVTVPAPDVRVHGMSGVQYRVDLGNPAVTQEETALATVWNAGSGAVPVTVSTDAAWLSFPASVMTASPELMTLRASVDPAALPGGIGTYFGTYTLSVNGMGTIYTGAVTLRVTDTTPRYEVRPAGESFKVNVGYGDILSSLTVVNTGSEAVTVFPSGYGIVTPVMTGDSFILNPGESREQAVKIAAGLAAGTHTGAANFYAVAGGSTIWKTYAVSVLVTGSALPNVSGSVHEEGKPGGEVSGTFTIMNPTRKPQDYFVSIGELEGATGLSNLKAEPVSGTLKEGERAKVRVRGTAGVDADAAAGWYGNLVGVYVGGNGSARVLDFGAERDVGPKCAAERLAVRFAELRNGSAVRTGAPSNLNLQVLDNCGKSLAAGAVTATFSNGDAPLALQPVGGGLWTVTWTPLNAETPEVAVSVKAADAAGVLKGSAEVTLQLHEAAGVPIIAGAWGGSGALENMTSSRGVLVITGMNLTQGRGTTVRLGDTQLAVQEATPARLTAVLVDWAAGTYPLVVTTTLGQSVPVPVTVHSSLPVILEANAVKDGESYAPTIARPAVAGGVLVLKAVGIPVAEVTASVGGIIAEVSAAVYADGVYTVTVQIPPAVRPANDVPVVLSCLGQGSPAVTVAIR